MIFHLYLKGYGTSKIANKLNQNKILTRYNKVANKINIGGVEKNQMDFKWVDGTIYSILNKMIETLLTSDNK